MKPKNILVTTDFSEVGNKAFTEAAAFTALFGGTITPMYVYEERNDLKDIIGEKNSEMTEGKLRKIREHLNSIAAAKVPQVCLNDGLVKIGNVVEQVVKESAAFDLVMMATNARTGINRVIYSSKANKVISLSKVPVFVLTEESSIANMERALILTDFSHNSMKVFPYAKELLLKTNAKVDLIHFVNVGPFTIGNNNDVIDRAKGKLTDICNTHFKGLEGRIKPDVLITSVSVSDGITNLTYSRDYNAVFMTTLGHSKLRNLMVGSTASTIIRTVDTGVYVLNPELVSADK
ncbi:MAG: universal stress protein [Balneolales bacterium]|nr:universal stress protein [Balneolales bacterium]